MESDGLPRQYIVGLNQTKKKIKSQTAQKVFLAKDADPKIRLQIETICNFHNIPCDLSKTKEELGEMCEIEVPCAVCCTVK